MVTTFYPPYHLGGDALFVRRLAVDLAQAGHHVEVVHCVDAFHASAQHEPAPESPDPGVIVHRLKSPFGFLSPLLSQQTGRPALKAAQLGRILDQGFDVINYHNISLIGGPAVLGLGSAAVKLYTLHEHWLVCPAHILWKNGREVCHEKECFTCSVRSGIPPQLWRYSGLLTDSLRHVDLLLSPSRYTADRHLEGGIGRPIRVLPTYVPGSAAPPAAPAERPRFVYTGRVVASKGIHWLAAQFAQWPEWDLDILGGGPLLDTLRERHGGTRSIRFHGAVPEARVREVVRGATALILPSLAPEVFPLCILEALAESVPCIVSRAGGSPEAIEESGAGFVYDDDAGFEAAVRTLAANRDLRLRMGEKARMSHERLYSRERYLQSFVDTVREVKHAESR